ncbi:MAG: hypothetical protein OQL28_06925 [Sedimenticola sp.]|nr:hypothetical protein [Sedimenticola sp.]
MLKLSHGRRRPDLLSILFALVGVALLATLSVHFHLLDQPAGVDPHQLLSEQRF